MKGEVFEETNIFVFTGGENTQLKKHEFEDLKYVSKTINFETQAKEILAFINNLAKTVNKNAFCLKILLERKSKKEEKLESNLFLNYLDEKNTSIINFLNTDKKDNKEKQDNPIIEITSKCMKDKIKETMNLNNQLFVAFLDQMKELQFKFDGLENKTTKNEEELKSQQTLFETNKENGKEDLSLLEISLNQKITKLCNNENEVKEKMDKCVNKISDSENRLKSEIKYLTQRIEEANKVIRSKSELGNSRNESKEELFNKYLEVTTFRKFQYLQKELLDAMDEKINKLDMCANTLSQMSEIKTPVIKIEGDQMKPIEVLDSKKNRGITLSQNEMIKELSEKVNDIERNLNKKIIGIDSRLKEIEDIKKLNKLVTRIQMELNLKINKEVFDNEIETKLDRNEFFDFANKNLISNDKIKTLEHLMAQNVQNSNKKINEVSKKLKKCQNEIILLETKFENVNSNNGNKLEENIGKLNETGNQMNDLEKQIQNLNREFEQTRNQIFELVTARINSLATTKPVCCLSCGARDVNYPPLELKGEGLNGRMFQMESEVVDLNKNFEANDKKQYKSFVINKQRGKTGKMMDKKTWEENMSKVSTKGGEESFARFSGVTKDKNTNVAESDKFVTGEEVFSREVVVHEHCKQRHNPVEHLISKGALKLEKKRPFSSMPIRNRFKSGKMDK